MEYAPPPEFGLAAGPDSMVLSLAAIVARYTTSRCAADAAASIPRYN